MGRLFGFDAQLLMDTVVMVITMFILFFAMSYLLFEPVRSFMEKRAEKIRNDIEEATKQKNDAASLKNQYEEKLRNIEKEADVILSQARKKALSREDEIIQGANEEAKRIIERANLEISREKEKVKEDIKTEMIEIAAILAEKFISASINESEQNKLIEETLNEMGDKTWLN
ncbi:F-type H+-transporting ATPase subunit b [Natranaerovirga pectinivora]|uniref:ATP synthase subunit b n=1 Tax=Natranaerovirga pectinivora TaxID=682400 RepID=A0A4V2UZW9_9FIRM|nr:F0F1 ATP synthase subunit B [Natranaerovirga pectinivora]TCT13089.1 F-type H+-transporting ATPase subunit b [Natranaerovirga pectinivora]